MDDKFGQFAGDGAKLALALVPDPVPDEFPEWLYERWDGIVWAGTIPRKSPDALL